MIATTSRERRAAAAGRSGVPRAVNDAETVAAARTIADVLWNDLNYEHEFAFVARDIYTTIPGGEIDRRPAVRSLARGRTPTESSSDRSRRSGGRVSFRFGCSTSARAASWSAPSTAGRPNPRRYAHTISDEIHRSRNLDGVARTKLASPPIATASASAGPIENRSVKEIYISDYDGENQQRVTVGRTLNAFPAWSPDARSIAYVSWRRGQPNIFVSHIYEGTLDELTKGPSENYTARVVARRHAHRLLLDTRRQRGDLHRRTRDGSNVRRLTNTPASTRRRPGRRTATRSRSRPIGRARRRSTSIAPTASAPCSG